MANNNDQVVVIRGKASFAKILGAPVPDFSKEANEWKMDLEIDNSTVKELKKYGIQDKVKSKDSYLDGAPHLTFKQPEFRKNPDAEGNPVRNNPIPVLDILNKEWDQEKLIGNGSDLEVKFVVKDWGPGRRKGMYIRSVRVLKLVEYAGKGGGGDTFGAIGEDDPFYEEAMRAAQANTVPPKEEPDTPFDLDDDVPL